MQPEQRVYQVWDRVDYIAHKSVRYRNGDNSTAVVDVAGRQGTINQVMEANVGFTYHRIAVDIRDTEIIPIQAMKRGVLEVFLTEMDLFC